MLDGGFGEKIARYYGPSDMKVLNYGVKKEFIDLSLIHILRITIPAGVANGQVIKLKGYGGEGINGGPAGDLYITFVIPDDSVFKRLGDDLYVDVTVDLYPPTGRHPAGLYKGQVKLKVKPLSLIHILLNC